jgi:hypothetical protein
VATARLAAAAAVIAAAALVLVACNRGSGSPPPQPTAEELAAYLGGLAARDPADIAEELAGWPLDRELWRRTLVEPYRELFEACRPDDRLRALKAGLRRGAVAARRHYAGDRRLTPGQAWLRWALPPLYPSFVAEIDGQPLDTVFLHDGARWRALVGLDDLIAARVRARDPACAEHLDGAVASTGCATAAWAIADAALRTGPTAPDRVARACRIAATLCGKRSP